MKNFKLFSLLLIVSLLPFFAVGCGGDGKANPESKAITKTDSKTSVKTSVADTTATAQRESKIKFKTPDGKEALVIKTYPDQEKIEIDFEGTSSVIKARANDKGRVKYKEAVGEEEKTLIAEVKYKDDGFKLVDANEKLMFKVKIKDEKIKISDNEEMTNPVELKRKDANKIEVRDSSGAEIGNIKNYPDKGKLKVKDSSENEILTTKNLKLSFAPGVILFKEIPVKIRCIIISEILKKDL